VRVRGLGGAPLLARCNTADPWALIDTFRGGYHLMPPEAGIAEPTRVWDLGANIGTTMAHFAHLWPRAEVTGVELDPGNAELCRRNVARFGRRCRLIDGGVWSEEGEIHWGSGDGTELGFRVDDSGGRTARAVTLDRLAAELPEGEMVDYVKMDIEGAEAAVLRCNTGWARRVRALKVEVHPPYSVAEAEADLRALGFATRVDDRHHAAVAAWRED